MANSTNATVTQTANGYVKINPIARKVTAQLLFMENNSLFDHIHRTLTLFANSSQSFTRIAENVTGNRYENKATTDAKQFWADVSARYGNTESKRKRKDIAKEVKNFIVPFMGTAKHYAGIIPQSVWLKVVERTFTGVQPGKSTQKQRDNAAYYVAKQNCKLAELLAENLESNLAIAFASNCSAILSTLDYQTKFAPLLVACAQIIGDTIPKNWHDDVKELDTTKLHLRLQRAKEALTKNGFIYMTAKEANRLRKLDKVAS